ncbi:MAG: hypothetical protein WC596_03450 [Candidatus Shapirobacteria bacterium]
MTFRGFLHHLNRRDTRLLPKLKISFPFTSCVILILSIFLSVKILAQTNVLLDTKNAWKQGTNMETWIGKESLKSNTAGLLNTLIDVESIPDEILKGQAYTPDGKPIVWVPGGALGATNKLIASLYTPPASGLDYVASTWNNFLGKPAYAQGIGFQGLQPILPIWRGFRNMVYLLSSLVFVIMGVMIILRVKISPQAVISVQNSIPKLITSLILVTFSYAIAGLIIDFAYLIQGIVLALIYSSQSKNLGDNLLPSFLQIPSSFTEISDFNFGTLLFLSIKNISLPILLLIGAVIGGGLGALLGSGLPVIGFGIGLGLGAGIGAVAVALIMVIAILFFLVRFLFGLIKCYVTIILKIVISPLEIGLGALPGSKVNFSSWLTDLVANISVFPISLIFLVLVNVICESIRANGNVWAPGIINLAGNSNFLPFLFAMGSLLLLQKLPELIPQVIFQLKPSPFGQAIGQAQKEITSFPGQTASTLHVVSGIRQDVTNVFGKRKEPAPKTTPETQPNRPTIVKHNQIKTPPFSGQSKYDANNNKPS